MGGLVGNKISGKANKKEAKTRAKNTMKADAGYLLVAIIVLGGGLLAWRYWAGERQGGAGAGPVMRV